MIALLPGEKLLTQSSDGSVSLTTQRICYEYKEKKQLQNQRMKLEDIISIENNKSSQVWFLLLAAVSVAGGILGAYKNDMWDLVTAAISAVLFAALYWVTRFNYIVIATRGEKMKIKVLGMKKEQILSVIKKIELAKQKRLYALNR